MNVLIALQRQHSILLENYARVPGMKLLKIAIFAQLDSPTITEQLAPLLRERGHTVDIIDLSTVSKTDFAQQPEILALTKYDLVYYRSGLEPNDCAERIIKLEAFLKIHPIQTVNLNYTNHPEANSKTYEAQQAEMHGLAIPKSVFTDSADFSTLSSQLGLPFIAKTDYGTKGTGVHMIENAAQLTEIQATYQNVRLLYQQFVPHDLSIEYTL
jgi:glutathione synthase/RimK-type ligase-like ATP-grasp enzyme